MDRQGVIGTNGERPEMQKWMNRKAIPEQNFQFYSTLLNENHDFVEYWGRIFIFVFTMMKVVDETKHFIRKVKK